jgi:REP element-mobilizing transposase RayT
MTDASIRKIPSPYWHSRGYLPHFESDNLIQHVIFRLADSLPKSALARLDSELKSFPPAKRDIARRKRIDELIDIGHGSCILRKPYAAKIVQESLFAFDSQRYRLLAWVVMPNHVHVLLQSANGWSAAEIVGSWKKFTARRINSTHQNLERKSTTSIWQREYWDRVVRDERHYNKTIEYIHLNPVTARLATKAEDWPWSSAHRA